MTRRRRTLLAVFAALAGVVTLLAVLADEKEESATGGPPLPAGRVTILQDDAEFLHRSTERVDAGLRELRGLGVDWLRVTASWSSIAPAPDSAERPDFDATDPGAYPGGAWVGLDRAVALAGRAGLDVMIDIAFWAPRWAVEKPSGEQGRERWGVKPADYADFAEAVATRYPQVTAFGIWNEPNYRIFLLPQHERRGGRWVAASPHLYRAMLYASAPRIRSAAPGALILIGNTAAAGADDARSAEPGVSPMTFVREMACVDEALKPLDRPECRDFRPLPGDGFAHHPYTPQTLPAIDDPDPQHVRIAGMARLDALLGRLRAAGRTERRLPLFSTEYGYETNPPDPRQPWTPDDQANLIAEAEMQAHRGDYDLRGWAQFLLRDLGPVPGPAAKRWSDFQSGLRSYDGAEKPALAAFRFPLVARPAPGGAVRLEGRVRPRDARGAVTVEARTAGGRWVVARSDHRIRTDAEGFFAAVLHSPAGATAVRARAGTVTSRPLVFGAD